MSARQVRKTVEDLLKDDTVGLAAAVEDLASAEGLSGIQSDFNFVRGMLSGKMLPTGQPNIAVVVRRWTPEQKLTRPVRDARVVVQIMGEFAAADQAHLEDQRDLTVIAVVKALDGLREFSDANGGTVMDVDDPFDIVIGEFGGPVTTEGFTCSATILERSTT